MGETFFININCSKILESCDESQYTIFIDTTKMSIVYELTEWIRWMFSLDHCFYLMHENSVIHELEDVQFLSKLKNFDIKPCGQSNCVHKKLYRSLLENLNLFVCYNNIKVHKYFLDKLNKMDKNFSQENSIGNSLSNTTENKNVVQNCVRNTAKTDYNKFFFHEKVQAESGLGGTPLTKKQVLIDNFVCKPGSDYGPPSKVSCSGNVSQEESVFNSYKDNLNPLNYFNITENSQLSVGAEKSKINHSSPIKNELKATQATTKTPPKPSFHKSSHKHPRPFTVGELLSNIRGSLDKQYVEETSKPNNISCTSGSGKVEEIHTETNLFFAQDHTFGGRKRPRTRKRKKSKKENQEAEEEIPPFLDAIAKCSLKIPKSISKPNHIRFDMDEDLKETDGCKCELSTENSSGGLNNEGIKDNSMIFVQSDTGKFVATNGDTSQNVGDHNGSLLNNSENKMEVSSEYVALNENEAKLIDLDELPCESVNHTYNLSDSSKSFNQNLEVLMNLKEKFKSAVVIERFY